jgi:NADPH-dependent glutamate synthase beta subunit-like oxidoreductase
MASPEGGVPNIYAYRGRRLLSQYHARCTEIPDDKLSKLKLVLHNPRATFDFPVCIIGAGMAGLYTAMIFESLGINYHIVDADTKKRVGGRMFTYNFPDSGPYDYYVGKFIYIRGMF